MNDNNDTLSVVPAYHRGWTTKHFDEATRLLSADLKVEVPINTYATTEAFAKAIVAFGSMTTQVDLLAEFAHGDQAMLRREAPEEPSRSNYGRNSIGTVPASQGR